LGDMDDLDAFFDDVDQHEKAAKEEQEETTAVEVDAGETKSTQPPPAKRIKVSAASSAPVMNIVAPSVPTVTIAKAPPPPTSNVPVPASGGEGKEGGQQQPPLPPPLPPNAQPSGKTHVRSAAGETWTDPTLAQWPENDFRLFVGNLAKDLKQHHLEEAFGKYPSFAMARVMYNKNDGKSRGYGFVSVMDPKDCAKAIREMNQSWLGSRPIKVSLSEWKDRQWKEVKKKGKAEKRKNKRHF